MQGFLYTLFHFENSWSAQWDKHYSPIAVRGQQLQCPSPGLTEDSTETQGKKNPSSWEEGFSVYAVRKTNAMSRRDLLL